MKIEIVEYDKKKKIMARPGKSIREINEEIANNNRGLFKKHGIISFNILGSVGSGKTAFVEQLAKYLHGQHNIYVINGDLTTTIDAERVQQYGATAVQINTGTLCHLDAKLVQQALNRIKLEEVDILIIENVGNLICPAGYSLGEDKRIVVASVTEGPYFVVKHPHMFLTADIVLINKIDLAQAMDVDIEKLANDIRNLKPDTQIFKTNCKTGEGIKEVIEFLKL